MPDEEPSDFEQIVAETELASPQVFASNLLKWAVERRARDLLTPQFARLPVTVCSTDITLRDDNNKKRRPTVFGRPPFLLNHTPESIQT